jgi:septal ring factor EnvC (AmiA/AmiB activator)
MYFKILKWATLGVVGAGLAGGVILGTDAVSYVKTTAKSMRTAVKDQVPIEFEIRRARDMLDEIIPEMHANIRLVARQEVEIANIKADIAQHEKSLAEEQARVHKLRESMNTAQASYSFGSVKYTRDQVKDELSRKFDQYKESEMSLAGKKRLLENQERSLAASLQIIERTRSRKSALEQQIASLDSQFRLVCAASGGSNLAINDGKLAQTERLIAQVKKQIDVAERVLAHEAKFTDTLQVDVINESDLMASIDEHFNAPAKADVQIQTLSQARQ